MRYSNAKNTNEKNSVVINHRVYLWYFLPVRRTRISNIPYIVVGDKDDFALVSTYSESYSAATDCTSFPLDTNVYLGIKLTSQNRVR